MQRRFDSHCRRIGQPRSVQVSLSQNIFSTKGTVVIPVQSRAGWPRDPRADDLCPSGRCFPVRSTWSIYSEAPKQFPGIVDEILALKPLPAVIWMQLTVRHDAAARKAEAAGIKVIMDRCPKIEYAPGCPAKSVGTGSIHGSYPRASRSCAPGFSISACAEMI